MPLGPIYTSRPGAGTWEQQPTLSFLLVGGTDTGDCRILGRYPSQEQAKAAFDKFLLSDSRQVGSLFVVQAEYAAFFKPAESAP